ncbi:MAG: HPr(Ser) kinase/phosphatase [Oscillospiraceae bacterium]|nr:HPr(Ser) kinase/phosphatase [Oscillospiraceae bacterium]
MSKFYVTMDKFAKRNHLDVIYSPQELTDIKITSKEVNRPGLMLTGFEEHFDAKRIQVIGNMETSYLKSVSEEERDNKIKNLFSKGIPAVVITSDLGVSDHFIELAKEYNVPVLRSHEATSSFMASAISFLNVELAERITRHGVLVEVHGEGVLIIGDSGVGKSETAIELVKRGHRLIADDAVEIRKVSNHTLVGQSPSNIRHFIELRGVGIINIARAYGSGAVKQTQGIDMVIELENWNPEKSYSTTGLDDHYMDILGINVIKSTVPVRPGRNLSIIIETAAITNRQKKMGYNPARELISQLGLEE